MPEECTYAVSVGTSGTSCMMCMSRPEMLQYLLDELTSFGDLVDPVPATNGNCLSMHTYVLAHIY